MTHGHCGLLRRLARLWRGAGPYDDDDGAADPGEVQAVEADREAVRAELMRAKIALSESHVRMEAATLQHRAETDKMRDYVAHVEARLARINRAADVNHDAFTQMLRALTRDER